MDTNIKIVGEEKFASLTNLISLARVELYTTLHLGSAIMIYDFINEYLDHRRAMRAPEDREDSRASSGRDKGLNPINEVSSRHEHTKDVGRSGKAEFSKLDSASDKNQPSDGAHDNMINIPAQPATAAMAAANQIDDVLEEVEDESFVPDQHFANQRLM